MCAAFWFASVLNALLNTCGCVCLLFTCRMQRAFGRLLQRTVPNPARDSSVSTRWSGAQPVRPFLSPPHSLPHPPPPTAHPRVVWFVGLTGGVVVALVAGPRRGAAGQTRLWPVRSCPRNCPATPQRAAATPCRWRVPHTWGGSGHERDLEAP